MSAYSSVPLHALVKDVQSGFASGKNDPDGIIQVRMNNVDTSGHLAFDSIRRVPTSEKQLVKYALVPGDVLFNNTNSPELVGKSAFFNGFEEEVVFSNHFTRIRTDKRRLNSKYLSHYFVRLWRHRVFAGLCTQWVNQAAVRKDKLLSLSIPLPPLAEQKRIAAILDQADAIRRKRQEAINLADTFLRSVFLMMFGDPVTNPMGWDEVTIDDHLVFLTSGSRGWAKYYSDSGAKFIRIQNVRDGFLSFHDCQHVTPPDTKESDRTRVQENDLLLSITADLGRTAVVDKETANHGAHINQHIALIRLNEKVNPDFNKAFYDSRIIAP